MKGSRLRTILVSCLLVIGAQAQRSSKEEQRFQRQSDGFNFPGPRRAPVFGDGGGSPRPRPGGRPFRPPPPIESNEGGLDSFQEPDLPPPRRQPSFRPSDDFGGGGGGGSSSGGGGGGSRFASRPQFSQQDLGSDPGPLKQKGSEQDILEEDKKPEPDRLTILLQDSKFSCSEKKPGYYADDGLSCEVFHYCNEGVRHSWMCPAGTSFHQIHLICMQEGGDNICKQSTKYHFVNDYLYKPIADSSRDNNGTIRYANRYFPDEASVDQQQVNEPQGGGGGGGGGGFQPDDIGGGGRFRPSSSSGGGGSSFRPSRPPPSQQSEEEFFSPPPPRHSGGGSRFRPIGDDQFGGPPPQHSPFASGSRSHPAAHGGGSGSTEDLGSIFGGSDEFQSPPPRVRQGGSDGGSSGERRPSGSRGFPNFVRH